ncbi:Acg family FMN-binding oxidoreductase [Rhizomonospora bruguierae]|uniref:Acg family FMN-binding oxidoreductase n=1 Tax=Rhizomonospora bruguierae TaxID=1581705 RepID=UPI001BCB596B|nr:nitroreductase family protein [Micromonospora sp. NBRC 107566]
MSDQQATPRPTSAALTEAAAVAGYAPSVHNTQPWRWRILPDAMELYAERSRQLSAADPEGHLMLVSCGAALHHAVVALAAAGRAAEVRPLPDPDRPDLLARVTAEAPAEVTAEAMRRMQAIRLRHTDRRPVSDTPVPEAAVQAIVAATTGLARLHLLTRDQVLELAAAASAAAEAEQADPQMQEELAYWRDRALPPEVLPERPAQTTVPVRDFGAPGTLPIGPGHDRAARYAVLYGDDDEPRTWLLAGQALSAAWLAATQLGVSMVPLSSVIEVPGTRQALRRALADLGYPYLVLRLGVADPERRGPAHPPRLPVEQVIDTSAVAAG